MDNLRPALPKMEIPENLTEIEFQNSLALWLEDKGIIADIRSQICYKMVNILRNTIVGKNTCQKISQNASLLTQALNMIVAEYLSRNKYEYTFSIFITEASLTILKTSFQNIENKIHKNIFNNENLSHVFEIIGISKMSNAGKEILEIYQESDTNSVLYCLILYIIKMKTRNKDDLKYFNVEKESDLVKHIIKFLNKFCIPLDEIKSFIETFKDLQDAEIHNREAKHLHEVVSYKKQIKIREKMIQDISRKNKQLEKKVSILASEYQLPRQPENDLKVNENAKLKIHTQDNLREEPPCILPHCGNICKTTSENLAKLKEENVDLRKNYYDQLTINKEKEREIVILSKKYNNLTMAFKDCQNKLLLLSTRVSGRHEKMCSKDTNESNHLSSELSFSSLTEDIVLEAKERLKVLEEESKEIEARFSHLFNV